MANHSDRPSKSRESSVTSGLRQVLDGRVSFVAATREAFRRGRARVSQRRERAMLAELASQPARLQPEFERLSLSELLKHFRERAKPSFFSGFEEVESTAAAQREFFADESRRLVESATTIANEHRWPLLGFGEKEFGRPINWHRDPLSGRIWPLDYHADIPLWHNDGSDIRVLWELNRLGHFITLGRAYAITSNEEFAEEFLVQLESWHEQNPLGRGANWSCAMEVALRSINLLAAFSLFRCSPSFTETRLIPLLTLLEQHGEHIQRNLEFSYAGTSNHYLSDVVGLLWLGIMLPELHAAEGWREFGLREMLQEMDKQILPDGADYEASTGYHRFKSELLLYSLLLCTRNGIDIDAEYWRKVSAMINYLRECLRPDGRAPLIGDSDSGQVMPIVRHAADDHSYLSELATIVSKDWFLKTEETNAPEELLWILGEEGLRDFSTGPTFGGKDSKAFRDAGSYILRKDDVYLFFNASDNGIHGRGAHGHNDALSIEVSAYGTPFIVDPGTFVYTADLHDRHLFRSTAYHSTIEIDGVDQNTTNVDEPFVIGNEAKPRMLQSSFDWPVSAEHYGYRRLRRPVVHKRTVKFARHERIWLIEDELRGKGVHSVAVRFHFNAGLEVVARDDYVEVLDPKNDVKLVVSSMDLKNPKLENQFVSRDYGSKVPSVTACWTTNTTVPCRFRWAIVPVRVDEDLEQRMTLDVGLWTSD